MEILQHISEALQKGDDSGTAELTQKGIDQEIPAKTLLDDGLIAGMSVIGEKFKKHEIFLPEVRLQAGGS